MDKTENILKVLVVSSMPLFGVRQVNIKKDRENLQKAFANSKGAIEVHYLPHATVDAFMSEVHKGYNILHFIGHGTVKGDLIFEEKDGQAHGVSSRHFVDMLNGSKIELISFIACHSYSDVVAEKLKDEVNAVVAVSHKHSINARAALQFNKQFYNAIACGNDIDYAFNQGKIAVASDKKVGDEACKNRIRCRIMEEPYFSKRFLLKLKENKTLISDGTKGTYAEIDPLKTPENIPQRVKGELFIGREEKMVSLNDNLENYHIINLNGPPGVGKTSLVREVANWQHEKGYFRGGIIWHMTEEDVSPDGLLRMLAKVLFSEEQINFNKIHNHLKQNRCLLIVDNFETVMERYETKDESAKQLINFLSNIPGKTNILITSRRNELGFRGETNLLLEGLYPQDARELFIEIAERKGWKYDKKPKTDEIIDNICTFLGGIPLAIELSAPLLKVKHLSLPELYRKLREEIKLLKSERLNVPDRLKNYYTSLGLSYRLLGKNAKKLFAMMSVFAGGDFGGANRNAINKIIGMENWQDAMEEIEKHDLVYYTGEGKGTRWKQLPIIRAFASGKLKDFGVDVEKLKERHSNYYLEMAWDYNEDNILKWKEVDFDGDNIKAGLEWAIENSKNELISKYVKALEPVLYYRKLNEGERWFKIGAEACKELDDDKGEGFMYNELGLFYGSRGNYPEALKYYQKSKEIDKKIGDTAGLAVTYSI